MSLKSIAQKTLDNTLLQYGVLSHHLRRIKTDVIKGLDVKVNDNEYVVYRIKAFVADKHFRLKNAESDIADIDNPYRGINVEFSYLEAIKRE